MTCRTLFALFSAAMSWLLTPQSRLFGQESSSGHIILAQAKQDDSGQNQDPATDAKDSADAAVHSSAIQMPAKKAPPKPAKGKATKATSKPSKTKAKVTKPKPKPKPKPVPPKPAPKPIPPKAPAPVRTPYVPPVMPAPTPMPQDEELYIPPPPNENFQVPIPEEKGSLNIWGLDPVAGETLPSQHQFGLIGIANFLGAGFGVEYVHRQFTWLDWGVNISSTQAKLSESKNPDTDEILSSQMTNFKGFARVFNNRSLFVGGGLNLSRISGSYGWEGAGVANGKISTDFKTQLLVLDFYIGSEWELGQNFYFGADWLGLGVPLTGSIDYEDDPDLNDITKVLTGHNAEERIRTELSAQFRPYYMLLKFGYRL